MGFGFIEYASAAAARRALTELQGKVVDGHKLQLKASEKQVAPGSKAKKKSGTPKTKLIVRNVAFQANHKEVRELFVNFGQLKSLRMPKKMDGNHRGFAFVEFMALHEAVNAFEALSSTHLYGRHLVLEWAEDKDGVDETASREKASRDKAMSKKKKGGGRGAGMLQDILDGEGGKSGGFGGMEAGF